MKKLAVGAVALAAMTGSALAADIVIPPPPPPAPVLFDWSGPYAGLYAGWFGAFEVGAAVGYNFVPGPVVGIEAQVGLVLGLGFEAIGTVKVGAIVGAEDRGLIYAEGGGGFVAGPGLVWNVGGGVAFGVGDSASIFVDTKLIGGGGCCGILVQAGVNFHFGN